jgi:MFS family permease
MVYLGRVVCAAVAVAEQSGFSAGEIGWSYACTAIAAILSPILVGSLTDRFFPRRKCWRC